MSELSAPSFLFPNQHFEYFHNVEELMEENGAELDQSNVIFVGGTSYGQNYKARHPEAEVTVIEENPIASYIEEFAAYQLDQGYSKAEVEEMVFIFEEEEEREYEPPSEECDAVTKTVTKSSRGNFIEITDKKYELIKERHKDFIESDWSYFDEDFLDNILYEPGFDEYHLPSGVKEGVIQKYINSLEISMITSGPLDYNRGEFWDRIRNKISSITPGKSMEERIEEFCDETIRELSGSNLEKATVDEIIKEYGLEDLEGNSEGLNERLEIATENIQKKHLSNLGYYSLIKESNNGGKKIALNPSLGSTYIDLMAENRIFSPVDNMIIGDVKNVEADADIIFTNNVFDYLDEEKLDKTVDNLSSSEGAFLERVAIANGSHAHNQEKIEESENVKILEEAPTVNFWYTGFKKEKKQEETGYEGVRIFQPANN